VRGEYSNPQPLCSFLSNRVKTPGKITPTPSIQINKNKGGNENAKNFYKNSHSRCQTFDTLKKTPAQSWGEGRLSQP
jgi:hypothetical protein